MPQKHVERPKFNGRAKVTHSNKYISRRAKTFRIALRPALILGLYALVSFATACHNPVYKSGNLQMSRCTAIEIASNEFLKIGYGALDEFYIKITDEVDPSIWSIYFECKQKFCTLGKHAIVDVNKFTGETLVLKGE